MQELDNGFFILLDFFHKFHKKNISMLISKHCTCNALIIQLIANTNRISFGLAKLITIFSTLVPSPTSQSSGGSRSSTVRLKAAGSARSVNSLSLVNNDSQMTSSKLGRKAGVIGACLLVRDRLLAI